MSTRRLLERGERARVARRVRALLADDHSAASAAVVVEGTEGLDPPGPRRPPESSAAGHGLARPAAAGWRGRLFGWLQRKGIRVDPGHHGGVAMGVAAVVAALIAGWWVLSSRPHAVAVSRSSAPASDTPRAGPASSGAPDRLVVDIIGKVRRPGVYRLSAGARVDDALRAAGGALPGVDLSSLNLARKVVDGEQIAVGVLGAVGPGGPVGGGPPGSGTGGPSSGPINLNTAGAAQFDTLPGVGPVLAQRILDWRTAHGRFESVDQLREVTGIGPSRFADLKPLVTV